MRLNVPAVLGFAALALSGCGDGGGGGGTNGGGPSRQAEEASKSKPQARPPRKPDPEECLKDADLEIIEEQDKNLWRGIGDSGGVNIEKFGSKAEAKRVVAEADLVVGEAVGKFAVIGQARSADDGSVATVAECLRG